VDDSSTAAGGRILLVDDDPVGARYVMQILGKRAGFEVSHAADPATGLALAGSESWDLVLTDVEMPDMSGDELLTELRQTSPGLPIALLTSHQPTDSAVSALRGKADGFLAKPVPPGDLIDTVTALVAKGRAARG
jgi:DNA-binding response OmpR family regulator